MDNITELLLDGNWWIAAIFAGLLIDLIKDFIKGILAKFFKTHFEKYLSAKKGRRLEIVKTAMELSEDYDRLVVYFLNTIYRFVRLSFITTVTIVMMVSLFTFVEGSKPAFQKMDRLIGIESVNIQEHPAYIIFTVAVYAFLAVSSTLLLTAILRDKRRDITLLAFRYYMRKK